VAKLSKKIIAVDCETDPFRYGRAPKPFAWGYYDGETYEYFWGDDSTERFIDYIKDEDDAIIYAHNGGKFDFFFILKHLDADVMMINGRIAKATLFDGRVEIRDSYLILPLPLAAHDKDVIDYIKMERDKRELHKQEILRYLQKDCTSLWDWIKQFRDQFGGGLTLAGAAFKELKKTGYPAEATSEKFDNVLRPFYQGGRVQCLEVGAFNEPLQYVDINSAYPYAMTFKHWQGSGYSETYRLPKDDNGSFFIVLDAISRGALPYRDKTKTYYPIDDVVRTYSTSGWEVLAGLRTNTLDIKKIHRVYKPLFKISFGEYVDKFFKLKQGAEERGDKTLRTFAKLMLNSCYGKFGQDGRNFEKFCILPYGDVPPLYKDKRGEFQRWESYSEAQDYLSIFSRPDPVDRFYNVATAASVTGFVRAYWWENACKSEGVIYGDTDSMLCRKFGGEIGDKLGQWKLEANITEAYIAQRKMYAMLTDKGTHKVASKGVRLTYEQIKNGVITGENIDFEKDAPAFSIKFGARFTPRTIDFKNISKNACNNPEIIDNKRAVKNNVQKTITYSLRSILCQ
jgi:hypothetical protein